MDVHRALLRSGLVALVLFACLFGSRTATAAPGTNGPGPVVCQAGQIPEGEPVCHDGYVDDYNGGYNSEPPVFQDMPCNEVICGTMGTYVTDGVTLRDTDWYRIELTEWSLVTWTGWSLSHSVAITTLDAAGNVVGAFGTSVPGVPVVVSNLLAPGTWLLFISSAEFAGVPCETPYIATIDCVAQEPVTGACCHDDGTCVDAPSHAACVAAGGTWNGLDTECATMTCPGGACCLDDGSCADVATAAACTGLGGTWNGAETECATVTCPGGACCLDDGSCADEATAVACAGLGGTWSGAGTECATVACPGGACCLDDGSCSDEATAAACAALGGT
ncbi:MAG: hypothetical protein GY715_21775, partial [Planctomycetes bacterium]|nr:hypothetical protein [Planctomycetota bacterium]